MSSLSKEVGGHTDILIGAKYFYIHILKKNYLFGPALILVDQCEVIEDVWDKLTNAYGNMKLLLQNKISRLDKLDSLDKSDDDEKVGQALSKILNAMSELSNMATK